ncbi:hypothetical protein ODR38_08925 [Pediococcus acidilactici]
MQFIASILRTQMTMTNLKMLLNEEFTDQLKLEKISRTIIQ